MREGSENVQQSADTDAAGRNRARTQIKTDGSEMARCKFIRRRRVSKVTAASECDPAGLIAVVEDQLTLDSRQSIEGHDWQMGNERAECLKYS